MGSVTDRWTRPGPAGKRVRTDRWGRGKRWLARWVDDTDRRQSRACSSKDEALALLARVDVDRRSGTYVSPSAGAVTVAEWADLWRSRQLHHRPSTAALVESRLRVHVLPHLGRYRLADLTRGQVQDLVASTSRSSSPATVRSVHVLVSSMLGAAVEDRLLVVNPARGVRLPEVSREKVTPLSVGQVRALREGVPPRWRVAVDLGAASGMRVSEMLGLTWDRVVGDVVTVDRQLARVGVGGVPVFGPPKTAAGYRSVRLDGRTVDALAEHRAVHGEGQGGLVVSSRRGWAVGRARAAEAWQAAGVPGLRDRSGWHDLRHFHASVLISAGVSVRAVADRLGHDDPSVTLRTYAHLMPSDEARSVAAVEAVLWG